MYYTNQPRAIFDVGSKKLHLDVIKAEEMLFELNNAEEKNFSDGSHYYKLYSRFHCLVLNPAERNELIFQLREQLEGLSAQANSWLEAREQNWQANIEKYEEKNGKGTYPLIRVQDICKKSHLNN